MKRKAFMIFLVITSSFAFYQYIHGLFTTTTANTSNQFSAAEVFPPDTEPTLSPTPTTDSDLPTPSPTIIE